MESIGESISSESVVAGSFATASGVRETKVGSLVQINDGQLKEKGKIKLIKKREKLQVPMGRQKSSLHLITVL